MDKANEDLLKLTAVHGLLEDRVLVQLLDRFRDDVLMLRSTRDSDQSAHRQIASRLCKTSREIRFQLGPPTDSPVDTVLEIVGLLNLAADEMVVPSDDNDFIQYQKNVRERGRLVLEALEEFPRP